MFAKHILRKLFLFITSFSIFFSFAVAKAFNIDEASFKFIKQQYKKVYEVRKKLDKAIELKNRMNINHDILDFKKRTEWFVQGIFGEKKLTSIKKETVLFVKFHEGDFNKNLISNVSFNIFSRCLFKILGKEKISKYELEAFIDNLIVLIGIEHYKEANENIYTAQCNLVAADDVKNTKVIDLWCEKACKVLNVKKEDMVFTKKYVGENFECIDAVNMKNLVYSINILKENFKEVLEEIVAFSDMFIGIINNGVNF